MGLYCGSPTCSVSYYTVCWITEWVSPATVSLVRCQVILVPERPATESAFKSGFLRDAALTLCRGCFRYPVILFCMSLWSAAPCSESCARFHSPSLCVCLPASSPEGLLVKVGRHRVGIVWWFQRGPIVWILLPVLFFVLLDL